MSTKCECGSLKILAKGMCSACYNRQYRQNNPQYKDAPSRRPQKLRALLDQLGDVCGICGDTATVVDHCHKSGYVRGPLCKPCNLGLGMFRDDPERLKGAIEYLDQGLSTLKYPL